MRHPMHGQDFQHQAFFHYVKKGGEYESLKYDEREALLSSKDAETWNHDQWSDDLFRQGEVGPINNIPNRS